MKGKLRKITIDNEIWHWIVEDKTLNKEVRIYSPLKKLFRVSGTSLTTDTYYIGIEGSYIGQIKPILSHRSYIAFA